MSDEQLGKVDEIAEENKSSGNQNEAEGTATVQPDETTNNENNEQEKAAKNQSINNNINEKVRSNRTESNTSNSHFQGKPKVNNMYLPHRTNNSSLAQGACFVNQTKLLSNGEGKPFIHLDARTYHGNRTNSRVRSSPFQTNRTPQPDHRLSKTNVYIGNLEENMKDSDLQLLCSKYGRILGVKCALNRMTGLCSGYGFVEFSNESEASFCIDDLNRGGRYRTERAKEQPVDSTNLYFANLRPTFTEEDLISRLKSYGNVISARILRDKETGSSKGVGFVRMDNAECCQRIIEELNGKITFASCKAPLFVKLADQKENRTSAESAYSGGQQDKTKVFPEKCDQFAQKFYQPDNRFLPRTQRTPCPPPFAQTHTMQTHTIEDGLIGQFQKVGVSLPQKIPYQSTCIPIPYEVPPFCGPTGSFPLPQNVIPAGSMVPNSGINYPQQPLPIFVSQIYDPNVQYNPSNYVFIRPQCPQNFNLISSQSAGRPQQFFAGPQLTHPVTSFQPRIP